MERPEPEIAECLVENGKANDGQGAFLALDKAATSGLVVNKMPRRSGSLGERLLGTVREAAGWQVPVLPSGTVPGHRSDGCLPAPTRLHVASGPWQLTGLSLTIEANAVAPSLLHCPMRDAAAPLMTPDAWNAHLSPVSIYDPREVSSDLPPQPREDGIPDWAIRRSSAMARWQVTLGS